MSKSTFLLSFWIQRRWMSLHWLILSRKFMLQLRYKILILAGFLLLCMLVLDLLKDILWNNLIQTAGLHNLMWVVAGDFNEPLTEKDKFGARAVSVNRSLLFKECLDKCNMIDIGF